MSSNVTKVRVSYEGPEAKHLVVAYTSDGYPVTKIWTDEISLSDILELQERFFRLEEMTVVDTQLSEAQSVPEWPECSKYLYLKGSLDSINILLDPGHSRTSPGATGMGSEPLWEYDMNLLQARILAKELRKEGAHVALIDPDPDNLTAIAMQARDKNLYLSLHHDAFDGNGEGTTVYIHPEAGSGTEKLGASICEAISAAIGSKNRGVLRSALKVLRVSEIGTNCPLNLLVESYFIDNYLDVEVARTRSAKAARAMASAIVSFFEDSSQPLGFPWMATKTFESGKELQLSKNFYLSEMDCKCGCEFTKVSGKLIQRLQKLRDFVGRPVHLNSGYRCVRHNAAVGGVRNSYHTRGAAADIVIPGIEPEQVQNLVDGMFDGVGRYGSFTHVDVRGYMARW